MCKYVNVCTCTWPASSELVCLLIKKTDSCNFQLLPGHFHVVVIHMSILPKCICALWLDDYCPCIAQRTYRVSSSPAQAVYKLTSGFPSLQLAIIMNEWNILEYGVKSDKLHGNNSLYDQFYSDVFCFLFKSCLCSHCIYGLTSLSLCIYLGIIVCCGTGWSLAVLISRMTKPP